MELVGEEIIEEKTFEIKLSNLYIDPSVGLKVRKSGPYGQPENTFIYLGEKVLYSGKPDEYEEICEKISKEKFKLSLDKNLEFHIKFHKTT